MTAHEIDPPEPDNADTAYGLVRATLSAIPVIGGPAVELLSLVIQPSLERRRLKWMDSIAQRLSELYAHGLPIERLMQDEAFVTALLRATQAALRTHQAAKLEALQNALINIAVSQTHNEVIEQIALNCIDDLTTAHLRLLLAVNDFPFTGFTTIADIVAQQLPDIGENKFLTGVLWRDLETRDLVNRGAEIAMPGHRVARPGVTRLGRILAALIRRQEA